MKKRRYIKGRTKVKNVKKPTFDGIKFQSKLEMHCYKKLKEEKIPIEYEGTTFTIFPATVYPLACYEGTTKRGYANESFPLRWKLFKKHLKDTKQQYVLFMPRNKSQVDEVVELIKQL